MDTKNKVKDFSSYTEEEVDYAEEALSEYERIGHTERRCQRCGGKFRFFITSSAYRISCENCDFQVTCRGI